MGLVEVVFAILLTLKLLDLIQISWLVVFSPFLSYLLIIPLMVVAMFFLRKMK